MDISKLPITPVKLLELAEFVRANLKTCDNEHTLTTRWLMDHGYHTNSMGAVSALGGCCCDCEVAYNFPKTIEEITERLKFSGN